MSLLVLKLAMTDYESICVKASDGRLQVYWCQSQRWQTMRLLVLKLAIADYESIGVTASDSRLTSFLLQKLAMKIRVC